MALGMELFVLVRPLQSRSIPRAFSFPPITLEAAWKGLIAFYLRQVYYSVMHRLRNDGYIPCGLCMLYSQNVFWLASLAVFYSIALT